MKIEVDISGQIQQNNYDSALGFRRENGLVKSVYLRSRTKKDIIRKYKNQVTNLIEKLHCIMIYLCIKDDLNDVKEIKICRDVNYRKIGKLLPFLFKDFDFLKNIKIKPRRGDEPKSAAHRFALRTFRRRKYASLIITKEVMEEYLFEFKEK